MTTITLIMRMIMTIMIKEKEEQPHIQILQRNNYGWIYGRSRGGVVRTWVVLGSYLVVVLNYTSHRIVHVYWPELRAIIENCFYSPLKSKGS